MSDRRNDTLYGVGASQGLAVGKARRMMRETPVPPAGLVPAKDLTSEKDRALTALEETAAELEGRSTCVDPRIAEILHAQALMARDPALHEAVTASVDKGYSAPRSVYESLTKYREALSRAGEYIAARATDIDDVRDRAVSRLLGIPVQTAPHSDSPFILVAKELTPSDTALLDPDHVLGFVTEEGGPTSHTAIVARALGVPAVVACGHADRVPEHAVVVLDGTSGTVEVDPGPNRVAEVRSILSSRSQAAAGFGPGLTADGFRVQLLANVGNPADIVRAIEAGAEGIGLFRTEFLYLGRDRPPDHGEEIDSYRAALESFPHNQVVVRVLDFGADKRPGFAAPSRVEPNPALGVRGLRALLEDRALLRRQLSAVVAAGKKAHRQPAVMAPMVALPEEAHEFAAECRASGVAGPIGVMIETPSAALRARDLLSKVDFLSVGTNDLSQYTFAADRQIGALASFQDPWQPALLDLVSMAADAARHVEKPSGICGEAAADPALACVLVGLGATSLSMDASALPFVRAALGTHTQAQCRNAADLARAAASPAEGKVAARGVLHGLLDLGL